MLFEYDPEKSRLNKQKHGIDFEEAKALWEDDDGVQVAARSEVEKRWLIIAKFGSKIWTAVFTLREKYIRIISVRSARQEERDLYGKEV